MSALSPSSRWRTTPTGSSDSDVTLMALDIPSLDQLRISSGNRNNKHVKAAVSDDDVNIDAEDNLPLDRFLAQRFGPSKPANEEPLFRPDTPPPTTRSTTTAKGLKRARPSPQLASTPNKKPRAAVVPAAYPLQNPYDAKYIANNIRALNQELAARGIDPIKNLLQPAVANGFESPTTNSTVTTPAASPRLPPVGLIESEERILAWDSQIEQEAFCLMHFGPWAEDLGYTDDPPRRRRQRKVANSKGKAPVTPIKPAIRGPKAGQSKQADTVQRSVRFGSPIICGPTGSAKPSGRNSKGVRASEVVESEDDDEDDDLASKVVDLTALADSDDDNAAARAVIDLTQLSDDDPSAVPITTISSSSSFEEGTDPNVRPEYLALIAKLVLELAKGKRTLSEQEMLHVSIQLELVAGNLSKYGKRRLRESGLVHAVKALAGVEKGGVPDGDAYKLVKRAKDLAKIWS